MSEITFTKFPTTSVHEVFGKAPTTIRVGVPGAPTFDYSSIWSTLSFKGTCFQAVFKSSMFYIHIIAFVLFTAIHFEFDSPNLRGATIPDWILSAVQTVAIFCVVFFTNRIYSRFNERFHDICKTNGGVTVVSALATGYLGSSRGSQAKAVSLCRYTVSILHVYYFLITGAMDRYKWDRLVEKGLLTRQEVSKLEINGSPGVVLYAWCATILHQCVASGELTTLQADRIEQNISVVRGLAAKQIAYTITQVPLVYFSFITVCSHVFLLMTSWRAGQSYVSSSNQKCTAASAVNAVICYHGYSILIIISQVWLLFIFSALYVAAVWMSDPMGTRASNYDLNVDLTNLWNEAQNAINAMLADGEKPLPVPQIEVTQPGKGFKLKARSE